MIPVYVVRKIEETKSVVDPRCVCLTRDGAPGIEHIHIGAQLACECKPSEKRVTILSAWPDPYYAKHEAQRWEEDSKVEHDVIEGVLVLAPHRTIA